MVCLFVLIPTTVFAYRGPLGSKIVWPLLATVKTGIHNVERSEGTVAFVCWQTWSRLSARRSHREKTLGNVSQGCGRHFVFCFCLFFLFFSFPHIKPHLLHHAASTTRTNAFHLSAVHCGTIASATVFFIPDSRFFETSASRLLLLLLMLSAAACFGGRLCLTASALGSLLGCVAFPRIQFGLVFKCLSLMCGKNAFYSKVSQSSGWNFRGFVLVRTLCGSELMVGDQMSLDTEPTCFKFVCVLSVMLGFWCNHSAPFVFISIVLV